MLSQYFFLKELPRRISLFINNIGEVSLVIISKTPSMPCAHFQSFFQLVFTDSLQVQYHNILW